MAYKKCPRCNLNYIKEHELLCKICLDEVGKAIRNNEEDELDYDICPECGENIIKSGEDMCYQCMVEHMKNEIEEENRKLDEWEDFLPKDEEEELFDDEDQDLPGLDQIEIDEEFVEDEEFEEFDEFDEDLLDEDLTDDI